MLWEIQLVVVQGNLYDNAVKHLLSPWVDKKFVKDLHMYYILTENQNKKIFFWDPSLSYCATRSLQKSLNIHTALYIACDSFQPD